jgi:hypothetical protein
MATFNNDFKTDRPLPGSPANKIDTYILAETKKAINERNALEHQDYETGSADPDSPTAQGRHIAGKVGVLFVGTWTELGALTGSGVGSIAFVTDGDRNDFYYLDSAGSWSPLALSAETFLPDETFRVYDNGGSTYAGMEHATQQWTEMFDVAESSGTITIDANNSNSFAINYADSITIDPIIHPQKGATYILVLKQVGGNKTVTFDSAFKFPGGITPIMTDTVGAIDVVYVFYTGSVFLSSVSYDVR